MGYIGSRYGFCRESVYEYIRSQYMGIEGVSILVYRESVYGYIWSQYMGI